MSYSQSASLPEAAPLAACTPFDAYYYLAERAIRADFVMVEIGHGGLPVAYQQPAWEGHRRYFGAEAWLRDTGHEKRERLQQLIDDNPNPNVQFLVLELDGQVQRDEEQAEEEAADSWYAGPYNPAVPLPDGEADEVFLGNVFGDPHIADSKERTSLLLAEAGRLVARHGYVIIRETISPKRAVQSLTDEIIESVGLHSVLRSHQEDKLWLRLEKLYDGETTNRFPNSNNFYRFLARADQAHGIN